MRFRLVPAALVAVCGLSLVAAATAAGPTLREHERFTEVIDDFCGTGQSIVLDGKTVVKNWTGTTGGDPTQTVKATFNLQFTYTNPVSGAAVVEHWSFGQTNTIVSGQESGVHTHEFTENGLKASFKLAHGPLLTRDAGSLTYRVTFNEVDEVTDFEVVSVSGPHPGFAYEGDFFCDTLVPALGLD